jgi:hypothetical protein
VQTGNLVTRRLVGMVASAGSSRRSWRDRLQKTDVPNRALSDLQPWHPDTGTLVPTQYRFTP